MTPGREPAVYGGIIGAGLLLAISYGLIKPEQRESWQTLLEALVPLIIGFTVRQFVVPNKTIKEAGMQPSEIVEKAENPRIQPVD